ncbi:MAG: hypothetical protein KGI84_09410, partial [Elusimicrobia bacterium]|nr:hypothetical protein [Elusimicrobiota bacterium]
NELKSSGIVDKLKAMKERTTLTLTEIDVKNDTPQVLEVRVKGYRDISSYLPGVAPDEVVFEDDLVLKKVPRSDAAPYGLLVEDDETSYFKK